VRRFFGIVMLELLPPDPECLRPSQIVAIHRVGNDLVERRILGQLNIGGVRGKLGVEIPPATGRAHLRPYQILTACEFFAAQSALLCILLAG
jgi:hypothetical protein